MARARRRRRSRVAAPRPGARRARRRARRGAAVHAAGTGRQLCAPYSGGELEERAFRARSRSKDVPSASIAPAASCVVGVHEVVSRFRRLRGDLDVTSSARRAPALDALAQRVARSGAREERSFASGGSAEPQGASDTCRLLGGRLTSAFAAISDSPRGSPPRRRSFLAGHAPRAPARGAPRRAARRRTGTRPRPRTRLQRRLADLRGREAGGIGQRAASSAARGGRRRRHRDATAAVSAEGASSTGSGPSAPSSIRSAKRPGSWRRARA